MKYKTSPIPLRLFVITVILCFCAHNLSAEQCRAITKKGTQCKREAQKNNLYCWQHVEKQSTKKQNTEEVEWPNLEKPQSKPQDKSTPAAPATWVVTEIIDGDTIVANGWKIRYIGINTPETSRTDRITKVLGEKAKAYNASLVLGKTVRLEFDVETQDKFGRLLAYVYVDNTFINAELIKQGYASASTFPPNVKHVELFRRLEREARENKQGLWRDY